MFLVIVDCVDIESGYKIPDKEGIDIIKEFHQKKNFEEFEKKFKKYLKNIQDHELKLESINLLKHLKTAQIFNWDCSFYVKKFK